jgi:hypothetical protein
MMMTSLKLRRVAEEGICLPYNLELMGHKHDKHLRAVVVRRFVVCALCREHVFFTVESISLLSQRRSRR